MKVSRHLRWLGVLACLLTALIWFLSLPFNTTITPRGHTINLCNGGIDVVVNTAVPSNDWSVEANSPREPMRWWFRWQVYNWSPAHIRARVPVWCILLVAGCATWAAWRAQRRHVTSIRVGKCRKCGYDLKGSPGGPCPECGLVLTDARV